MNKEIIVAHNKKIELHNVIRKELRNLPKNKLEFEVQQFRSLLQNKSIETYGPLIIRILGSHISGSGNITIDCDIISQSHAYKNIRNLFISEELHICSNCIYAHYSGYKEDLHYLYKKIEVYAYEHDLIETGIEYIVYLNEDVDTIIIDYFKQVEML